MNDTKKEGSRGERTSMFGRRNAIWWLGLAYGAAYLVPGPGLWLRVNLNPAAADAGMPFSGVHLLLALLLFGLGLSTRSEDALGLVSPLKWIGLFYAARLLIVSALVVLARFAGPPWHVLAGGAVLVVAMPSAGSSSGWCVELEGRASLAMALILTSTLASIVLSPLLLGAAGQIVPGDNALDRLAGGYTAGWVLPWVLVPAAVGWLAARYAPVAWSHLGTQTMHQLNLPVLLLLNYANGAVGLPSVGTRVPVSEGMRVLAACVLLSGVLVTVCWWLSLAVRHTAAERTAFVASTSMSNTGLALVLVTTVLPEEVPLHLFAIGFTFSQHAVMAILGRTTLWWGRS